MKRVRRSGSLANDTGSTFMATCAIELRVRRAIDLAHSAGADLRGDFVGAETRAGSQGQAAVNYMSGTTTPTGLLLINGAGTYRFHIMSSIRLRPSGSCSHQSVFAVKDRLQHVSKTLGNSRGLARTPVNVRAALRHDDSNACNQKSRAITNLKTRNRFRSP